MSSLLNLLVFESNSSLLRAMGADDGNPEKMLIFA